MQNIPTDVEVPLSLDRKDSVKDKHPKVLSHLCAINFSNFMNGYKYFLVIIKLKKTSKFKTYMFEIF